ncbi:MAG TPA: very short patch repair endonuclease [Prolixibacteraceae bacterium]|nr:very short patch repair endonuclease [Prolixibacteraceae bacterium]
MVKYAESNISVPRFCEANGFFTTKDRSILMGKICSKDTKAEVKLRRFLWHIGIRFRKNVRKYPGTPDIVIAKYKLVIFVDGEFWHGFDWENRKQKLKSNRDFWIPKIERNMQRDKQNNKYYIESGWKLMRFWEHEIEKEFGACINSILEHIERVEQNNILLKD